MFVGLNFMYGIRVDRLEVDTITAAHRDAHFVILEAALDLQARLLVSFETRVAGGWSNFEDRRCASLKSYRFCRRCA